MSENSMKHDNEEVKDVQSSEGGYASVIGVCLMIISFSFIISALIIKMLS